MVLASLLLSLLAYASAQPPADEHLRTGQRFVEKGDYGRAIGEFEKAVGLAPSHAEAHYNLGNALRLWGDAAGAEQALRKALGLRPAFPQAHFALGLVLGDRVGFERLGLEHFLQAIAQDPQYAEAHFNIGVIQWKADEVEAALRAFRRAVELKPDSVPYRLRLGQALARAARIDEAKAEFQEAVRLDPKHFQARYQLGQVLKKLGEEGQAGEQFAVAERLKGGGSSAVEADQGLLAYQHGMALLEQGRVGEAIRRLKEALSQSRDEARVRNALGIAYQRSGAMDAAAAEFRKILELDGSSVDGRLNLGSLLAATGDLRGAEQQFRECIQTDPAFAEAHLNLGLLLAGRSRWPEAAAELRRAVELNPTHSKARWNLARVLRDAGEGEAALGEYRRVCRDDGSLAEAHLEFGTLLEAAGRGQEAVAVWTAALQRHPLHRGIYTRLTAALEKSGEAAELAARRASFDLLSGNADYERAVRRLDAGDSSAAATLFRSILMRHPEAGAVRYKLAVALFGQGEYAGSAAEYARLATAFPGDFHLRLQLAVARVRAQEADTGRRELQQLVQEEPESAAALFHLGSLLWAKGERQEAMELFHRARRLDPGIVVPH